MLPMLEKALHQMPAALTVLDLTGKVLFYNDFSASFLDRKPEYIGRDVRGFHLAASNEKVDYILKSYARGSTEMFTWQLSRDGNLFQVRVAPLMEDGKCTGLLHVVLPVLEGAAPKGGQAT